MIIDTDVLIDFLRKDEKAVKIINELKNKNEELKTTSINSFELIKGALRSNNKDAILTLSKLFGTIAILNFDFQASEKAAEIFENLRVKGELIDPLDLQIASIVILHNEVLLTRNLKHFKRINELKIESL